MGGGGSKIKSESTNTFDQLTKTVTNISSKNTTSIDQVIDVANELDLSVRNARNCTITLGQKISAQQVSVVDVTTNLASDIKSQIEAQLTQSANAAATNKTDAFSSAGAALGAKGDDTETLSKIQTTIQDIVETTITYDNLTNINNEIIAKNKAKIELVDITCTPGFNVIDIAQEINVAQFSEKVAANVYDALVERKIDTVLESSAEAASSSEATTVSGFTGMVTGVVNSVTDLVGGIANMWMIGVVVILCILAVFFYFFMNSEGGQATLQAGMSLTPQGRMAAMAGGMGGGGMGGGGMGGYR